MRLGAGSLSLINSNIDDWGVMMGGTRRASGLSGRLAAGVGLGFASYAGYVAATWIGYGAPRIPGGRDDFLDRFMPNAEVSDRHWRPVHAPADTTFTAACTAELGRSPIVRVIFKARELVFGAPSEPVVAAGGIIREMQAFGWGILAEVPGREIVFGAVTQPWKSDVRFRALPPEEFASFDEPGYVKIVWMLRADPTSASESILRTETRVSTTDQDARARFRWYWSFLSPGIKMIRVVMLAQVKATAQTAFSVGSRETVAT